MLVSQFDFIEAIKSLGNKGTRMQIKKALPDTCPEKSNNDYFGLTIKRLIENGKFTYVPKESMFYYRGNEKNV